MAQPRSAGHAFGTLLLSLLLGAFSPVGTRAQTREGEPFEMEEVVVTGSALPGGEGGALPVRVITREEIATSGAATVTDVLRRLPQNSAGFSEAVNTGVSFAPGAAGVALRGLNVNSTLVLLNGRRLPVFPFAQSGTDSFVDINTVPVGAIERIEVLKDGASALYGSDAVAGVVNLITVKEFSGVELSTQYGNTSRRDAGEVHGTAVSGISQARFSLMIAADYLHRNALAAADRRYSRSADLRSLGGLDFRSPAGNPGTVLLLDSGALLAVPRGSDGRSPASSFPAGDDDTGGLINSFDTSRYEDLIPETERRGFFGRAEARPFDHLSVFVEGLYQHNRTKERAAPDITGDLLEPAAIDGLVVPASNPFNSFGTDVAFTWRAIEAGPRRVLTETEAARVVAGVRLVNLPKGWDVEFAALAGEVKTVSRGSNQLSIERTIRALNDPDPARALNVFGDGKGINSARTIDGLKVGTRREGRSELRGVDVRAGGELFNLPGGPLRLAVGAEYREEELSDVRDQRSRRGDILSQGGTSVDGDRSSQGAYYELAVPVVPPAWKVPLVESFDLHASGRYEVFSDVGETFKPKFAAAWKPIAAVLLRGSYSEAFRVPSLAQLFTGEVTGFTSVVDPETGEPAFPQVVSGGNPDLQPETAYTRMLGVQIDPPFVPGLTLEADIFHIDQRNLIQSFDPQLVANRGVPGDVVRDAGGEIVQINTAFRNFSSVVVQGVDLSLRYLRETTWGTWRFQGDAQFLDSFRLRTTRAEPVQELADTFTLPDFKAAVRLGWERDAWSTAGTINYIDGYGGVNEGEKVGAWTTLDLQLAYEFRRSAPVPGGAGKSAGPPGIVAPGWRGWLTGARVSVGVENVFDEDPPFANSIPGYDSQTHDPRGRYYYFALRTKF